MKSGHAPIHWGGHWRRGRTHCDNGHPYTEETTGQKSVKRWSKTLGRFVVYKTRHCLRCRRASVKRLVHSRQEPKRGRWYKVKRP